MRRTRPLFLSSLGPLSRASVEKSADDMVGAAEGEELLR